MRIIKTQQDIDVLRRARALPAALLDQIEDYFLQLRDELEDEVGSEFCLERHEYIVVLEAGVTFMEFEQPQRSHSLKRMASLWCG
ncbi:hypothetical protein [Paenibacillus sp. IHBB 10380]|uniref:hypothetical protein n=1 Tax=Paenibacillus sp. IHBB 10380 TaxID=1566358 RepID=UPI0005CF9F3A|nr:hypothetical protein [Paenibacillus sp. IHBB 10380]AJS58583.1 hypothetical protein UB51_08870 [Paenibacillus sp. IHBB 10380]